VTPRPTGISVSRQSTACHHRPCYHRTVSPRLLHLAWCILLHSRKLAPATAPDFVDHVTGESRAAPHRPGRAGHGDRLRLWAGPHKRATRPEPYGLRLNKANTIFSF
jgi:hypothetical protein